MKRLLLAAVIACLATPVIARDYDATIACHIGQAAVSLRKRDLNAKISVKTATDIAYQYGSKRCKGRITEEVSEYIHYSIRAMAKEWFSEDD